MIFGGIQRFSTIDFPGLTCCVLFVRGCDLNCFYCHNRSLIQKEGETLGMDAVWAFLEKRRGLLDGVVVSGGEPTLAPDLADFLKTVRAMGYQTKLDTNGQRPETVLRLYADGLLDYVALDLKALPEDYAPVCGAAGFIRARETIDALLGSGARFEVRTTLYPGLTAEKLTRLFSLVPPVPLWRLNFYRIPDVYALADSAKILQPALDRHAVTAAVESLRAIQPHIVF